MSGMTSRERVLTALEHREPDRIPIDFASFTVSIYAHPPYGYDALCRYLGLTDVAEPQALFCGDPGRAARAAVKVFTWIFGFPAGFALEIEPSKPAESARGEPPASEAQPG